MYVCKRKAQNTVVLGLEVADGMVKTTLKQLGISDHLDLLEHRATMSAGKPVSILRVIAEKISPFLPSWFV